MISLSDKPQSISIYIHIPFCSQKCEYCDFYSIPFYSSSSSSFCSSLRNEILFYSEVFKEFSVRTIYIGGGTPSVVSSKFLEKIIDWIREFFDCTNLEEFTVEMNPESVDKVKLKSYKEFGVNRISMGIQSFSDDDLRFLGRNCSARTIYRSLDAILQEFENVSVDFIAGLPYSQIIDNLSIALLRKVPHLSVYILTLYQHLPLYQKVLKNLDFFDEKGASDYIRTIKFLKEKGYSQYEISNFARSSSYISKHNYAYWTHQFYLGIGPFGSSFFYDMRVTNGNLEKYEQCFLRECQVASGEEIKEYFKVRKQWVDDFEILDKYSFESEYTMLSLRTVEGMNLKKYKKKFGIDFLEKNKKMIEHHIEVQNLNIDGGFLKIFPDKFIYFNDIVSDLL